MAYSPPAPWTYESEEKRRQRKADDFLKRTEPPPPKPPVDPMIAAIGAENVPLPDVLGGTAPTWGTSSPQPSPEAGFTTAPAAAPDPFVQAMGGYPPGVEELIRMQSVQSGPESFSMGADNGFVSGAPVSVLPPDSGANRPPPGIPPQGVGPGQASFPPLRRLEPPLSGQGDGGILTPALEAVTTPINQATAPIGEFLESTPTYGPVIRALDRGDVGKAIQGLTSATPRLEEVMAEGKGMVPTFGPYTGKNLAELEPEEQQRAVDQYGNTMGAIAAVVNPAGIPSAAQAAGNAPVPPTQLPQRIEDLLGTETAEPLASQGIVSGLKQDLDNLLSAFRKPAAETVSAKNRVTSRLVQYDGDVARAIPRDVSIAIRDLRRQLAEASGVEVAVPSAIGRVKAAAESMKLDANVPDRIKTAITLSLDDFGQSDVDDLLSALTPAQRQVRDAIRTRLDEMGDALVRNGVLDQADRKQNYVSHIWEMAEQAAGPGVISAKTPTKKGFFEKQRSFATFEEGIKAGYVPKTLDPLDLLEHFEVEAKRRIAASRLIDDIRHANPDLIKFRPMGKPVPDGYEQIQHPLFQVQLASGTVQGAGGSKVNVADLPLAATTVGRAQTLATEVGEAAFDVRILKPEWVVRKDVAPLFRAMFEPSKLRQMPVTKVALEASATLKRSVLGAPVLFDLNMTGFETKALSYAVGPFKAGNIFKNALRTVGRPDLYDEALKDAVLLGGVAKPRAEWFADLDRAGLTSQGYTSEIVRMMGEETPRTILGRIIPGYEKFQNWGEAVQFDDLIPKMKYEGALFLAGQKIKDGMPVKQALKIAANDMNKAMGGLNKVQLGRSKTTQDALAFALIAPDWAESRLRNFASIFQPGPSGKVARQASGRMVAAGIGSVVAGTALWGALNGKTAEQIQQRVESSLSPIKRDAEGKAGVNPDFLTFPLPNGQRTTLLTWELDGLKVAMGLAAYAAGDAETGDILAGRYAKARFGMIPRLGLDIIRNKDWKEQPIATGEASWEQLITFIGKEAVGVSLPANVQEVTRIGQGIQSPEGAALSISGFGRTTPRQEMPDVIRQALKANNLDENRVSSFTDLPPTERGKLMQNPEVEQFFQGRKTEESRLRGVEYGMQQRKEDFAKMPREVQQALQAVGIQEIEDGGNTISVVDGLPAILLSRTEQAAYQARSVELMQTLLPRLLQKEAYQRVGRNDQKDLLRDVMGLARDMAKDEALQQIGAAEIKARIRAQIPVPAGR